eukprot:CAMPEP_0196576874 /NCGR_PEP_ID=MMETSP1081-20130531/6044_1 /TAXON_ID=36882 /ORGANISM="Pyramimonas amylifera, Strain CCMP720" /LENGTH=292 /DNA_ID=CAMNT_0041895603 /DNA_START=174 /DNA_END=1052 /DNA_ORIENTATION=-
MQVRNASHAGSWYEDSPEVLSTQLGEWLDKAVSNNLGHCRAIIAPHAGYSYSGPCAAFAYQYINSSAVKRVFLLGPSHHHPSRRCLLSKCTSYRSPLGDLPICKDTYASLNETGKFDEMERDVDEAEHSLEMHLPYICKVMEGKAFTLVPIMVGSLSPVVEAEYGELLKHYIDDPANLFVVSSDFCHWGKRFNYTFYDKQCGPIHKSIEALDYAGMEIIERQDIAGFTNYLHDYSNTICGRHPIGILLNIIMKCQTVMGVKFVRYEQSSKCTCMKDSSVSYASAVIYCTDAV